MAVNKKYMGRVNNASETVRAVLAFHGICYLCSAALRYEDSLICAPCRKDLAANDPACPQCALPVAVKNIPCGSCLKTGRRTAGDFFAAYRFTFPINRLVHDLKYLARIEIADFLGGSLAQSVVAHALPLPQCLVPVPLHNSRLAQRGFNQSLEIARAAGAILNIPVRNGYCRRIINTPPQSSLAAAERRRNLKGSFAVLEQHGPIPGHIAIIDDVITTGSTVNEFAGALKRRGASRVDAWAVARTAMTTVA